MADRARADVSAHVNRIPWRAAAPYAMVVHYSLRANRVDIAGEQLIDWFGFSTADSVEEDSGERHNCRNLIESALDFLEAPVGLGHEQAEKVRTLCINLSAGAFPVLLRETQERVLQLSRR